ncbi:Ppx/GppA family phosphatase [Streptomyces sp. 891-h]|uniref:Ppx/GppA phosphatase family protein n=1 Tax=Streptomyces sp. 891-h TaxID=2720714 RepID=UPI001FAAF138|nr:Ppx/GppA family phosphatase [Streptomyces sp. 891-h]UNZ19958.1 Ppx/GppA family phosphatase [Streptomyces sp. 891-h]
MRVGVLDVGSNTVRLEIADADGAVPLPVHTVKYRLRLADDVDGDGRLPEYAVERLAEAATAADEEARSWGVSRLTAFATAIVREAPNRTRIVETVRKHSGLDLAIMSGRREAELTFLAARRWMGWRAGPMVLLDIGGGSVEVAFGRSGVPDLAVSVPLGAGLLTREHFGTADPPPPEQLRAVRRQIRHQLRDVTARVRWEQPHTAVATSRTLHQLARLCGAPPGREGPFTPRYLKRGRLRKELGRLARLPAAERADLPGISPARAGQALAGALVAHTTMKLLDLRTLTLCPWALREGVLIQQLEHEAALRFEQDELDG